ncbi:MULTISPECIES: YihY/virulence factor BrkB family protein [Kytococcus]|uniref:YihY/virulence factor BrkB family protein n=1 Tax=Kytococcus TaxID=57499 RepID=UPI0008A58A6D|nr:MULTISPECIES: YihY/virulence factor BrkB family protein [Kytococcus]OFS13104.1 hypothetical protein HMPREF3099_06595 [Kytococcus sp. HMSC28H12]
MTPASAADHADPPPRDRRARRGGRRVLATLARTRLVRAARRYLLAHGNVYAGGVTLSAMISLVAALTLGVTVFRLLLGRHPRLMDALVGAVNDSFPGLLGDEGQSGLVSTGDLALHGGLTLATLVTLPVLLWTATNAMTDLRLSLRAMFGLGSLPLHPVRAKLWDLVGMLLLGTSVVLTALLSWGATWATRQALDLVRLEAEAEWLVRGAALAAAALVDALTIGLLVRVAAKVRTPWPQRWRGALLGALGWGVLRLAGTSVIGAWDNPLVASFAGLVTLVVWINLAVRWALFSAAWTADPPAPRALEGEEVHAAEVPNYVTLAAPHTLLWPHHRVTGAVLAPRDAWPDHRAGAHAPGHDPTPG